MFSKSLRFFCENQGELTQRRVPPQAAVRARPGLGFQQAPRAVGAGAVESLSHRTRKTLWPSPAHTWHLPRPLLLWPRVHHQGQLSPSSHDTVLALRVWLPWVAFPSSHPARDPSDANTLPFLETCGSDAPFGTGGQLRGSARLAKPIRASSGGPAQNRRVTGVWRCSRAACGLRTSMRPTAQDALRCSV